MQNMLIALSLFSYLLIFALLLSLAYRDLKEYILPDYLNAALALSFMAFHIAQHWHILTPLQSCEGALMGGGILLFIRAIANRFYDSDSLGLGDVKLMTAAGLGLGYPDILLALTIGAFVGLLHGLGMAYAHRKANKHKVSLGQINVPAGLGLTIGIAAVTIYAFGFEWLKIH